jgi:hypothetical protein
MRKMKAPLRVYTEHREARQHVTDADFVAVGGVVAGHGGFEVAHEDPFVVSLNVPRGLGPAGGALVVCP